MAAFGELRQRVEGHEVANADAQRFAVGTRGAISVQTQLHVVPADRHFIHSGIERVAGRHQRQHAATDHAGVREHADPAAFGKAARPAADRRKCQSAIVFDFTNTGTNGVQVR